MVFEENFLKVTVTIRFKRKNEYSKNVKFPFFSVNKL